MRNPFKRGKRFVKNEENDLKDIWHRIKTKDFSGNTGLAVRNSVYQFSTNLSGKIGSFIFTVILARLLMPELFGLYALTLSTIIIFAAVADLGVSQAIIRFISKDLGGKGRKFRNYLFYFGKVKIFLTLGTALAILLSADYLANTFYQKPIFLALLAGSLYIAFTQISGFFQSILQAANEFRPVFKREIIFQVSRIILVPLVVILAIRHSLSSEVNLMLIILFLAASLLIASIFLFFDLKRIYSKKLKTKKNLSLSSKDKSITNKFLIATAALVLSGTFFGNIDRVMLGVFVEGEFIGFYAAAFSLIGALIPLIGFAAIVLLPIFSRLKGKRLEAGFKKSLRITLLISFAAFIATVVLAYMAILIIYGNEFLPATNILRALSLLLFVMPAIAIYQTYYISQGRPQKVAKLLISVTILNIFLNYLLISFLLQYGQMAATYGAALATLISQFVYLGGLVVGRRG